MATLKICVQKQRKDGFWPVYIRVTHNRKVGYIKTDKMVNQKGLTRAREVKDPYVLEALNKRVISYMERLNRQNTEDWEVADIIAFLKLDEQDLCFSEYARKYIDRLVDKGTRGIRVWRGALMSLEKWAGMDRVMFSDFKSTFIQRWIDSLEETRTAKEMYPIHIKRMFKDAVVEYNDYDNGIIRIKTNPWPKIVIPSVNTPEKRAITPQEAREFFAAPIPDKPRTIQLGRDVAMMILCLGGINTVDLYNLKKADFHGGIIHYKRMKTKGSRADEAYIEMRVPPILLPLFEKYKADEADDFLFVFHDRYVSSRSFGDTAKTGIRKLCEKMGLPKEKWYCCYTFRHTWGTVAQNDCGASISEVAFAMNHSSHKVTRGYIKIDFSPAWVLNEKVVDFIFFSTAAGARAEKQEVIFRFSAKHLIHGAAYFRGKLLGEVEDTGFNNVDEVIDRLAQSVPDTVPLRSMVQFKIDIVDKGVSQIYERMKGKGF